LHRESKLKQIKIKKIRVKSEKKKSRSYFENILGLALRSRKEEIKKQPLTQNSIYFFHTYHPRMKTIL